MFEWSVSPDISIVFSFIFLGVITWIACFSSESKVYHNGRFYFGLAPTLLGYYFLGLYALISVAVYCLLVYWLERFIKKNKGGE